MKPNHWTLLAILGIAALFSYPSPAFAQQTLGTATSFGVLGGSAVTNTGSTVVARDLGVWPNSAANAITGFPPGIVTGTIHPADAVAQQAQSDVTIAYNALAGLPCTTSLTGQDLGGKTLTPGVYCFSSSAGLTGALRLNAQGNSGAVWVFQIGSTLTTASSSSVVVFNGGSVCNVFWQVGSSATLGTDTTFAGNILALTSITLTTRASISGRALARNGAVTMDTNLVSNAVCGLGPSPTPALTSTSGPSPTPSFTATSGPSPTPTPALTATSGPPPPPPTFTATPGGPPSVVPTLSGWAMIAFGGLLAMVAFAVIRRAI
jgi:type VI secretion system secreted protein VgrG